MSFADDFADALTSDLMASETVSKGLVREGLLREVLVNDLKTPLSIPAVVFERVRALLHRNPRGLGQFDLASSLISSVVNAGVSIGTMFLKNSLDEDMMMLKADEALRIAQEQTKQAQLAYATSQKGAMGISSLIPGMPGWVLPVGLAATAAFFILPKMLGGRRSRR